MTPKKSVKGCVAAVVLLLSVVSVRPAGATIHGVDIGTGIVPYAGSSDLCAVANSWTEGWNWRCTIDNRAWAHSSVPFEEVAIGSTVTFSKKEVHGKSVSGFDTSNEPALSTFGRDISRLRWYVADSVELDTTTIPSASVMSTGSTGGSGGSFVYWARIRPLSWTRKFETLGDNAVKLRVDYTDGSFEESSGNIKVVADAVTAAVVKTISNGGAADTSNVLTGTTVYVSAGSSTSLSGVFSKFEWDLDGDGTYETDGGTTNTSSTSFTTSGSKTVGVRVTSRGGTTSTATTTIDVRKSPPSGEAGVSIIDGASYTNSKSVKLNLVWPEYATGVRISNDGGFAASKTQTKDLAASIDWELDDSVKGIYTKVVYVRFNGVADTTKTYSDDIILDTTAPTIETSSAAVASSSIDVSLKATDDITGVDKVELKNGSSTVTKDYAANLSVPMKDLGLTVSSASVGKLGTSSIEIRVSDKAGNWSTYKTLSVSGTVTTPTVTTPTVTTPTVTTPTVSKSKSATAKSIALYAKIPVLSTSKVSLKVGSGYAKYCKVSGTTLKGLKAGTCKVTVTVTPKKGKAIRRSVTLMIAN